MGQAGGNGGVTGGVPKPNQVGWYKRRLPILSPLPMPAAAGVSSALISSTLVVRVRDKTRRGSVVQGRLPLPEPIGLRPTLSLVVRSDCKLGGLVFYARPPKKPPPVNVAGGVLPPWVLRRDYQWGGSVFKEQPPLKAPPPPVAGAVPQALVRRWDFERAGLVYQPRLPYRSLPVLEPPPVLLDITRWYAEKRENEWDSDARKLLWSADVAAFLTKRSGETRQYTMDFSALPELQSATLSSVSSVTASALTVGASNVTLTNPALGSDGKSATVWIAGGVAGASYKITFTVTLAGGTVLEDFGYLLVEDE